MMKKMLLFIVLGFTILACKDDVKPEGVISIEDKESLDETGENRQDKIVFNGDYIGEIDGVTVELKLDDENFELKEGGQSYSGEFYITGEGRKIELDSKKGTPKHKFYFWSDENSLLVLTPQEEFPENEVFLKRKK